jgi:HlyD family secretion protein
MKKIKYFIKTKKVLSVIILLVLILVGYWIFAKTTSTSGAISYVFAKAQRKDIVTTISGTGQVSASSQIDIKSKVSGDIIYLNTQANGTQITKGTLIAKIDARDAEIALENAKIAYAKLVKPADASDMLQAETALSDAIASNKKAYEDGFNTITSTLVDLPTIINGLNDLFYSRNGYLVSENVRSFGQAALDYQSKAGISFDKAKTRYDLLVGQYKNFSRSSSTSTIEYFINDTYLAIRDISEAIKNTQNAIDFVRKQKDDTTGDTPASNVSAWTNTINSNLDNLLASKTAITSSAQSITQKKIDLVNLKEGADSLDIQSQQLSLRQKEYEYQDYFIRAPFDGLLARLSVKSTDSVSGETIIGTLVSTQKISNITLNEVDVAKVKVGQKVDLIFDAIDGLTVTGTVSTVDLVGTVSQGVVNYNVEIAHDTQDERVRSGMSVSASIITETKENVLTVPNSAIKTQGRISYVELFAGSETATPTRANVEIGMSNDTLTEIISGINEGDQVVTRTINQTVAKTTTPSLLGATGASRSGTNSVRIPR